MEIRNRMSAEALKKKEGEQIQFVLNPKTGKLFFSCGKIEHGYVSKSVTKMHNEGTLSSSDMQYGEVKTDDGSWIPCLLSKTSKNVVASY